MTRRLARFPALLIGCFVAAAACAQAPDETAARALLAERLVHVGRAALQTEQPTSEHVRYASALLRAAAQLNPGEPRYLRLLADAMQQLGDTDGELRAWNEYLKQERGDQVAQARVIELHLAAMETADARLKYVNDLLGNAALSDEVKSVVAVEAVRLHLDRADIAAAEAMLDRALQLNPLNPQATGMQLERASVGEPAARVAALVDALRCNPAQPAVMALLAEELSAAGLGEQALFWYGAANGTAQASYQQLPPDVFGGYCAALIAQQQYLAAASAVQALRDGAPEFTDAAFLKVLLARRDADPAPLQAAVAETRESLIQGLQALHLMTNGLPLPEDPTTLPKEMPNLSAGAAKLSADDADPRLRAAFIDLTSRLAWLHSYYLPSADEAAAPISALRVVLPEEDAQLGALDGWTAYHAGRLPEARLKFVAAAEGHPMAALGLILLEQKEGASAEQVRSSAQALLRSAGGGITLAVLSEALQPIVGAMPQREDAPQVLAELDRLPTGWLRILEDPRSFYQVKAEPLKVNHQLGEPMLVRVTIANVSDYDIAVGPGALLQPDLWFDAQVKGVMQQNLPGAAYERASGLFVLKAKQRGLTLTARVDDGPVSQVLYANPMVSLPLIFSIITNPVSSPAGVVPGPGGYRSMLTRPMERTSAPLATPQMQQQVLSRLGTMEPPATRVMAIELLATYARLLRGEQSDEEGRSTAARFAESIARTTAHASPAVQTAARYVLALAADEPSRPVLVQRMLSGDLAERAFGVVAARTLPQATATALLQPLADSDPDPAIRDLARSAIALAALPPAPAAPTTQPSGPVTGELLR